MHGREESEKKHWFTLTGTFAFKAASSVHFLEIVTSFCDGSACCDNTEVSDNVETCLGIYAKRENYVTFKKPSPYSIRKTVGAQKQALSATKHFA